MRPDLRQRANEPDSARIIHLGEVRTRRTGRRARVPDRSSLVALTMVGIAGWVVWLAVLISVAPHRLLTYLAFFVPLAIGLSSTIALAVYGVEWRRGTLPQMTACIRRGVLASAVVVANLALLASHRWGIIPAGVCVLLATAVDVALSQRRY